ncbi:putative histone acetyltransferase [Helianthus anomalus]
MLFKPRILAHDSENGSKQGNEGVLVIKKRNLLSWMIDLGVILVGMKVRYGKTRRQTRSIEGIITSDGIRCGCCNEIIGVSAFVAHCGGKTVEY